MSSTIETELETSTEVPCAHCGEPTYRGAFSSSRTQTAESANNPDDKPVESLELSFCCNGCRSAFDLIHGLNLEQFYALRDQGHAQPVGGPQSAQLPHLATSDFEHFDFPELLGKSAPVPLDDGTARCRLSLDGLHCSACAWLIENSLQQQAGVLQNRVRLNDHTIELRFNPKQVELSHIAKRISQLGYGVYPLADNGPDPFQRRNRELLIQIAIAGFLAANAMWIAVAIYSGATSGTEYGYFLGLIGSLLGLVSVLGPGRTFLVGAWAAVRNWTPHMDMPIALGLSVGACVGTYNAIMGAGDVYFDSLATLVFLLLLGRWIQFRQQYRAHKSVDLLMRLTPQHARQIVSNDNNGSTSKTVAVERLRPGDIVEVLTGDTIPVDGAVNEICGEGAGPSSMGQIDCSLLTGESKPVERSQGDSVQAGAINVGPNLRIRVDAVGEDSRVGKIMLAIEEATLKRTPIVMLADRIGAWFTLTVTGLAMLTFAIWFSSGINVATSYATALLIVACPCALALATPLAIASGIGRASKGGVLIREGGTFQHLATPGTIWFDKTGTLTLGKQRVTHLEALEKAISREDLDSVFADVAAVEARCKHPIAAAIVEEARRRGLQENAEASIVDASPGGLTGRVGERRILVGNVSYFERLGAVVPSETSATIEALARDGVTPVLMGIPSGPDAAGLLSDRDTNASEISLVGVIGLSDPRQPAAQNVVSDLQSMGWQVGILSGDHAAIATSVGKALGIEQRLCHGGLSPEEKLRFIEESKADGRIVAMVGDGANDAAALAAADVGIAVRGGAEVSLRAAPVYIARRGLNRIVELARGSSRIQRLIHTTFAVSLGYNCFAVCLAMAGWISPLLAALLMPVSSLSVLGLTMSSRPFHFDEDISPASPAGRNRPNGNVGCCASSLPKVAVADSRLEINIPRSKAES